jgi:hypothetical protein
MKKLKFPLVAKSKISGAIAYFTDEAFGTVINSYGVSELYNGETNFFVPCSDENYWQIIATPKQNNISNTCENCKKYEKKTDFIGECFKINMSVIVHNEIPEAGDFASQNKLMVRKEFGCILYE